MRFVLISLTALMFLGCGKFHGKDGESGAPGEVGAPGEAGEDGSVETLVCKRDLHYTNNQFTYQMTYVERTYADGSKSASFRQFNKDLKQVVTNISAEFAADEKIYLESPNWKVEDQVLTYKPKNTVFKWECK